MTSINNGIGGNSYTVTVVDGNNFTLDGEDSSAYNAYISGGGVYERPFYRTQTFKRVYAGGIGFQHRMGFVSRNANGPYRIHGFKPYFKKRGKRLIN